MGELLPDPIDENRADLWCPWIRVLEQVVPPTNGDAAGAAAARQPGGGGAECRRLSPVAPFAGCLPPWVARPGGMRRSVGGRGRPGRPARPRAGVSPTYAQGSSYGTKRVVVGRPGRHSGPAESLLSTTRAAPPSRAGRPSAPGAPPPCPILRSTNWARISEEPRARPAPGVRRPRPPWTRTQERTTAIRRGVATACPALRDAAETGTPELGGLAPQGRELADRLEAADRQAVVVVARR